MKIKIKILAIIILLLLTAGCSTTKIRQAPIVNMEPGSVFVNDLVLNSTLNFDPLNVMEVLFKSPTFEHPYHHLIAPVNDFYGGTPGITKVSINGEQPEFYETFANGQLHVENWLAEKAGEVKNIVLIMKYSWQNNKKYDIQVELTAPRVFSPAAADDYKKETTVHNVVSPPNGGLPDGWGYEVILVLSEENGIDRTNEPVDVELISKVDRVKDLNKEVRVMEYNPETFNYNEIPSQTYNYQNFNGRGPRISRLHQPSKSCNVFFLANVPANTKKMYAILYSNPSAGEPDYSTDLNIKGDGLGAVIENEHWEVKLHEKSGQLHYYKMKKTEGYNVPLYSNTTSGSVHWNPDTHAENGAWGHTFSWDPPEKIYIAAKGPLMYKITRTGRMPGNPEVFTSVTYTFMAHAPYVLMSSIMEIMRPYGASAIRNGEMVFDADLFDHYAWKAGNGERRFLRTLLNPDEGFDAPAMISTKPPWLCLYNSQEKYAFGSIPLEAFNFNKKDGVSAVYRPKYFLYCHPQWDRPLTYFVRTLVYPFGYNNRSPIIFIPEGNVYVEKGAFLPFILGKKDPFKPLEDVKTKLAHPLVLSYGN